MPRSGGCSLSMDTAYQIEGHSAPEVCDFNGENAPALVPLLIVQKMPTVF